RIHKTSKKVKVDVNPSRIQESVKLPDKGYSRHYKYLKATPLPIAPLLEQKRIAEKLDNLLEKLEKEKQFILAVEDKLDLLKQSILSQAFRGELGTNDPNDEHAIELLKEVLLQTSGQS
ncbi:hypothetical protein M4I42_14935, partial [Anoxybacillus sp. J5B_2022]|nr:hypothetical protein [Anoxybacillus sp. J5B_2022]